MQKLYLLKILVQIQAQNNHGTPDSSTRIMKKIKAMAQKIWKISILYPKTSKEFYHQIKFRKSIMSRRCFLIKIKGLQLYQKRDCNACVFLVILPNFYEQLFWRTSVNGCFWEFFLLCQSLNVFLHEQITANHIGGEEDVFSKTKQREPY